MKIKINHIFYISILCNLSICLCRPDTFILKGQFKFYEDSHTPCVAIIYFPEDSTLLGDPQIDHFGGNFTERLIVGNKNSKLVFLRGLTHYAPQEDPNYFNNEIDIFFEMHLGSRTGHNKSYSFKPTWLPTSNLLQANSLGEFDGTTYVYW